MNKVLFMLLSFVVVAQAQAAKPCEELKGEISAKLDGKGVKNYVLQIVPVEQETDKKIVGACDAGKMKITYVRQ